MTTEVVVVSEKSVGGSCGCVGRSSIYLSLEGNFTPQPKETPTRREWWEGDVKREKQAMMAACTHNFTEQCKIRTHIPCSKCSKQHTQYRRHRQQQYNQQYSQHNPHRQQQHTQYNQHQPLTESMSQHTIDLGASERLKMSQSRRKKTRVLEYFLTGEGEPT